MATYNISGFINSRQNVIRPCSSVPTQRKKIGSYSTSTDCLVQTLPNYIDYGYSVFLLQFISINDLCLI